MTPAEFDQQMRRLSDCFGAQHFKQERLTLLWRRVQGFSSHWLQRTVDSLIASHRQAPMPADFEEAISSEREKTWRAQKGAGIHEIRSGYSCRFCKDTGTYVCTHPEKQGLWAFRCHCERGANDPRSAIPYFTETHEREGYRFRDAAAFGGVSA